MSVCFEKNVKDTANSKTRKKMASKKRINYVFLQKEVYGNGCDVNESVDSSPTYIEK
tara:strand:- start:3465 stop:3635 length:171 start_codon:yes stop_codon:yes gene_type:complete